MVHAILGYILVTLLQRWFGEPSATRILLQRVSGLGFRKRFNLSEKSCFYILSILISSNLRDGASDFGTRFGHPYFRAYSPLPFWVTGERGGRGQLDCSKNEPHTSKCRQNGFRNRSKINDKSTLRRECVFGRSSGVQKSWMLRTRTFLDAFWIIFAIENPRKSIRNNVGKSMRKRQRELMPKGSEMMPKWIPKSMIVYTYS